MNSRQRKKAHELAAKSWRITAKELEAQNNWLRVALGEARQEAKLRHTFDLAFTMECAPPLYMQTPIDKEELKAWIDKWGHSYQELSCKVRVEVDRLDKPNLCLTRMFLPDLMEPDRVADIIILELVRGLAERILNGEED